MAKAAHRHPIGDISLPMAPRPSALYRLGNGDPRINAILRLIIGFSLILGTAALGALSFLAQSIYADTHNLDSQVPALTQHVGAIDRHMGNIDTNMAQMWTAFGEMRDRLTRMEQVQSDNDKRKR